MPDRPKGTFRLWDKDFNLLHTWEEGVALSVSFDRPDGTRWSGPVEFGTPQVGTL